MVKAIQSYFGEEIHTISFTHVTNATRLLTEADGYSQTTDDEDTDLSDDDSEGMNKFLYFKSPYLVSYLIRLQIKN